MYELLPEAMENLVTSKALFEKETPSGLVLMASYVLGVAIFAALNQIIHALTTKSVVHCAHENLDDGEGHSHGHSHSHAYSEPDKEKSHAHSHSGLQSNLHSHQHNHVPEAPAVVTSYGSTVSEKDPLIRVMTHRQNLNDETTSLEDDLNSYIQSTSSSTSSTVIIEETDSAIQTATAEPNSNFVDLLAIGLQTSLAISLHKIPEGFITYVTTYADPELGLSVFIALAIHNFIEGFTIAFPLYLALGSRWMALGAAFVLGGLSQPLGALIAWLSFRNSEPPNADEGSVIYGVIFGVVGGFLTIIALQMFATAVNFSKKPSVCINWAFAGIVLVGIAMSLGDV